MVFTSYSLYVPVTATNGTCAKKRQALHLIDDSRLMQHAKRETGHLRFVVTSPATTQASRGSAVKLTALKKVADAAASTAAGLQLQHQHSE